MRETRTVRDPALVLLLALDAFTGLNLVPYSCASACRASSPGLHFKWPIADSVKITDARYLRSTRRPRFYVEETAHLDSFVNGAFDVSTYYTSTSFMNSVRSSCCRNGSTKDCAARSAAVCAK